MPVCGPAVTRFDPELSSAISLVGQALTPLRITVTTSVPDRMPQRIHFTAEGIAAGGFPLDWALFEPIIIELV